MAVARLSQHRSRRESLPGRRGELHTSTAFNAGLSFAIGRAESVRYSVSTAISSFSCNGKQVCAPILFFQANRFDSESIRLEADSTARSAFTQRFIHSFIQRAFHIDPFIYRHINLIMYLIRNGSIPEQQLRVDEYARKASRPEQWFGHTYSSRCLLFLYSYHVEIRRRPRQSQKAVQLIRKELSEKSYEIRPRSLPPRSSFRESGTAASCIIRLLPTFGKKEQAL